MDGEPVLNPEDEENPTTHTSVNANSSTSSSSTIEFRTNKGTSMAIKKGFTKINTRLRSALKFSRSYYSQYVRYRFLKIRWINNCVVNFM